VTAVETVYLCTLTRRPSEPELRHFVAKLGDAKGPLRSRRLEDIQWTLMNSTEFSWSH
jgi:hypothetical protein